MRRVAFWLGIAVLVVSGCANDPESSHTTSNPEFQVGKLFEHDGCTVYRFSDNGRFVYYVHCGHSTRTSYQESCGKGCSREFAVAGSSCVQ